jgi:RNA polymerase sigma factor (sigma-70 family)
MAQFEERYDELFVYALRAARRIVRDSPTAEDIASEAVARAYVRWRRVEPHAPAWVTRVAVNLAIDHVRRKQPWVAAPLAHPEPTLDRVVLAGQLARLPKRQREALVLRYLLDLDEEQTAAVLGVTIGTVHTHVTRGLARVRTRLPADFELGVETP